MVRGQHCLAAVCWSMKASSRAEDASPRSVHVHMARPGDSSESSRMDKLPDKSHSMLHAYALKLSSRPESESDICIA